MRTFGRLAFFDHYRSLMGKIHAAIDNAVEPSLTERGMDRSLRRTNRPGVYVVAGLAGGTGGGMFLDVAYAVRNRLRRMGYGAPEVIGILVAPPADPAVSQSQALGNAHGAHGTQPLFATEHDLHRQPRRANRPDPGKEPTLRRTATSFRVRPHRDTRPFRLGGGLEWFASVFDSAHDPGGRFACDRQARFARDGEAGLASSCPRWRRSGKPRRPPRRDWHSNAAPMPLNSFG